MRALSIFFFVLCQILVSQFAVQAQTLEIYVPEHTFQIDETRKLIVSRISDIEQYEDVSAFSDIEIDLNGFKYLFTEEQDEISYRESYEVSIAGSLYTLYFTSLPLVSIHPTDSIVDEPKRHAIFTYVDDDQVLVSDMGIEIRGGFSQTYPKKTYDLEFWEDGTGADSKNVQFGNLRYDDDWIMDALYNEPLRIRSTIAHRLWLELHRPYYLDQEKEAKAGADVMFVELFLSGEYNGIYTISEQVDRKLLKLKKRKEDAIRGELYKGNQRGATTFSSLPNYSNTEKEWAGYEVKYPDPDDGISWDKLYNFTSYVMNGSSDFFKENVWSDFHLNNHIDYFIFLNLLSASDNIGKNIFLARYDNGEPYFYAPWDLDGCFGTEYRGLRINTTTGILTNAMHRRVLDENPDDYRRKAAQRWFELRQSVITEDKLTDRVNRIYDNFLVNKVYERESLVYPNYEFGLDDFNYMLDWVSGRIDFLDDYFSQLTAFDATTDDNEMSITPNPVIDILKITGPRINYNLPYTIYSSTGKKIRSDIAVDNQISMQTLSSGLYIILINNRSFNICKL